MLKKLRARYYGYSLSKRMSVTICIFSLVLLFLIGISAYRIALEESQEVIHRQMQEMANFLEVHNQSFRTSVFNPKYRYNETDVFIDVVEKSELKHTGLSHGYLLPIAQKAYFTNQMTSRGDLKMYVRPVGDKQIQISQLMRVRVALAKELAINMLLPYLFFVPLGVFGLYRLIKKHLRPLADLKQVFSHRHHSDLSEIKIAKLPTEIIPAINELNYLFERIAHAKNQQQLFVANAAHELRTPLTAIQLHVELLQRTERSSAVYQENLADLQLSTQRMARLVEQLMKLAHQDDMNVEQFLPIDVLDVLRQAIGQLQVAMLAKNMHFQVDISPNMNIPQIWATYATIESIFVNILDNAIKYTPNDGQILVKVMLVDADVVVEIHDSGSGIPTHQRQAVRDKFVRLVETQQHVVGSGLGLSIVDTALALIQGELTLLDSKELSGLCAQLRFKVISSL
ncbi:sensor histidine kinase [Acinetobacter rathckeae]|uniref:sensor histidine kinase n=1 Tax=Acinetobacter rathckeae TaxID=2605272 RepID=UPI001D182512|nr:HAMP domain-containing sensor histidine kinase [Acinetobacter rathckeae]